MIERIAQANTMILFYILLVLIAIGFILMALPTIIEKRLKSRKH